MAAVGLSEAQAPEVQMHAATGLDWRQHTREMMRTTIVRDVAMPMEPMASLRRGARPGTVIDGDAG